MKLIPLGVYGAYPQRNGGTSAYLLESGDTKVLVDFGSGALSRMQNFIDPGELSGVVLSHLHSDHVSDIFNYRYYLSLNRVGRKIPIYLPDCREPFFDLIAACPGFSVHPVRGGDSVPVGDLCFSFFEMEHPVPTLGMRIEADGRTLCYSADTRMCDNLKRMVSGADWFLADCALLDEQHTPASPHMSVREAAALARREGVKMLATHLMTADSGKILQEALAEGADAEIIREMETYFL